MRRPVLSLIAALVTVAGCGCDDPHEPEPDPSPWAAPATEPRPLFHGLGPRRSRRLIAGSRAT